MRRGEGGFGREDLTRVGVCESGLTGVKSGIDGWQDAAVEALGAVQERQVFGRGEVIVRADLRVCAAACTLQPSHIFTPGAGRGSLDGNELVSIERRRHHSAIG